jgi:hypothetical protein
MSSLHLLYASHYLVYDKQLLPEGNVIRRLKEVPLAWRPTQGHSQFLTSPIN